MTSQDRTDSRSAGTPSWNTLSGWSQHVAGKRPGGPRLVELLEQAEELCRAGELLTLHRLRASAGCGGGSWSNTGSQLLDDASPSRR
jgi:hypothetical protein